MRPFTVSALAAVVVVTALALSAGAQEPPTPPPTKPAKDTPALGVTSEIRKTKAGERILVQTLRAKASVEAAWTAHTTDAGYASWAAPQAKVDLRVGGSIQSRYDTAGKIGDPGTNTLTIINYVPNEVLTLRAAPAPTWPEFLKKDADNLSNVVLFRQLDDGIVEVVSYGIGYRDAPEYDQLLSFFSKANEGLLKKLKGVLEKGAK